MAGLCVTHVFVCVLAINAAAASINWPKTKPVDLNIATPPHIFKPERQQIMYITDKNPVTLECSARASPDPEFYKWTRNEAAIPADNMEIQFNKENGTLMISAFYSRHEGYYQCEAVNVFGTSFSQVIELRSRVEIGFNNKGPAQEFSVQEGEGIALPCYDRPVFVPPGIVSWYFKTGVNSQNQIPVHKIDRMEIDANGTLYITQVMKDDSSDDYACAYQTDKVDTIYLPSRDYLKLKVTPNPDASQSIRPHLLGHTDHVTVERGKEVTLECFFAGKPTPKITWRNGNRNMDIVNGSEGRFIMSPSAAKLRILRTKDDDEGNYVCEAKNMFDSATASTFLNVTSRPVFEMSSPQIIIAPRGSEAKFSCKAKGAFGEAVLPPPVWNVNGRRLETNLSPNKYTLSGDGSELTIKSVATQDRMCVQCNVTNSVGYAFGDGFLAVIDPLVLLLRPNKTVEVEMDESVQWVNLTIRATADPCCPVHFAWSFNDGELTKIALHEHPYSYKEGNNSATLSIKLEKDVDGEVNKESLLGMYRCDVWHSAYSDNITVTVDVKEKAKLAEQVAEAGTGWWSWIVLGVAVVLIAVVAIVIMVRYNFPRQEYLLEREEKKHKLNPEQDLLDQSFEEI